MVKKTFNVESLLVKSIGQKDGSFSGMLACYDNVDRDNEICARGCFKKSIASDPVIPILWQHDRSRPIGWGRCTDMPTGVKLDADLLLDTTDGQTAYAFMKKASEFGSSARVGLSVGFQPDEDGIKLVNSRRTFISAKLVEGSVVTFAANPQAFVTEVKNQKPTRTLLEYERAIEQTHRRIQEGLNGLELIALSYEIDRLNSHIKATNAQLRRR